MFYSVKTAKCIPHKIENPKKKKKLRYQEMTCIHVSKHVSFPSPP